MMDMRVLLGNKAIPPSRRQVRKSRDVYEGRRYIPSIWEAKLAVYNALPNQFTLDDVAILMSSREAAKHTRLQFLRWHMIAYVDVDGAGGYLAQKRPSEDWVSFEVEYKPQEKTLAAYKRMPSNFTSAEWAEVTECSPSAADLACRVLYKAEWVRREKEQTGLTWRYRYYKLKEVK